MTFDFQPEQDALRDAVAAFLAEHSDEAAVRATAATDTGLDPEAWKALTEQLDLVGLLVPERHGGSGAGPVELAVVLEQLGRSLFCGPYLSSAVLATKLLVELGEDAARHYLPAMAAGRRTATVALDEGAGTWDPSTVDTTAERESATGTDDGWTITGSKKYVLDGANADTLLVVTRGPRVFAVDAGAPGMTVTPLTTLDATRKQAAVTFSGTPARPLSDDPDATGGALRTALDTTAVLLAAEQVGGARAALDMAVDYARQRFQFGRAIGSFQAVKHKCADLFVDVESAYSAAYHAAWSLAEHDEAPAEAALAQAFCSEVFSRASAENIQIHGGIGFTWEHPAHLYLRRARSSEQLLGAPAQHRERYLTHVAG